MSIDARPARSVDYNRVFAQAIDRLHEEGRYRVFIDILRNKGQFPNARCFAGHNGPKPIFVNKPFVIHSPGHGTVPGSITLRSRQPRLLT